MTKKYKTEFHVHTRYSHDSILSLFLLKILCKIKKIDTIVITDHNEIKGALKCKEKFKKSNIEVIVGEEILTSCGEIIGLRLNKKIEPNLTPEETIRKIKLQNGLVYVPHPYDEKRYKTVLIESEIEKNKNDIDFIEIYNGRNVSELFGIKQQEIARKYNIKNIIGSDAHTFFEIGRNYILTDKKITDDNIDFDANNVEFIKKKCITLAHKKTKLDRVLKYIFKGDISGLFRTINRRSKKTK